MIDVSSCDRLQVGIIESLMDHDVAYLRLEEFSVGIMRQVLSLMENLTDDKS